MSQLEADMITWARKGTSHVNEKMNQLTSNWFQQGQERHSGVVAQSRRSHQISTLNLNFELRLRAKNICCVVFS